MQNTQIDMSLLRISHLPISSIVFRHIFSRSTETSSDAPVGPQATETPQADISKGHHWQQAKTHGIVDGSEIRHQLRLVVDPHYSRDFYIHQQYGVRVSFFSQLYFEKCILKHSASNHKPPTSCMIRSTYIHPLI